MVSQRSGAGHPRSPKRRDDLVTLVSEVVKDPTS